MKKILFFLTLFLLSAGMSYAQNVLFVKSGVTNGDVITVDGVSGKAYTTPQAAVTASAVGDTIRFTEDYTATSSISITNRVLDGNNHKLTASGSYSYPVVVRGGTVMNLTIRRTTVTGRIISIQGKPIPGDVVIDNCDIDDGTYGIHRDDVSSPKVALTIKNSTIRCWSSWSDAFDPVTISNCTFAKGSSGYAHLRPYGSAVIEDCSFSSDFSVSTTNGPIADNAILFSNCDIAGVPLTSESLNSLLENHNQEASNQKGVVVNGSFSQNASGEITGGVFGGNPESINSLCATGYGPVAQGTTPETYEVTQVYYVHYNANGGTGTMNDSYVDRTNPTFTVPANTTFTNGSWTFDTWNTKADGTGDTYAPGSSMTISSDTTLYAQWKGVAKIGNTHYLTLNEAAAAVPVGTPTTITILQNLNFYDIAQSNIENKTITFTGTATDTLTLSNAGHPTTNASGANLTFETITLKNDMEPDGENRGIIHLSNLTINDCEIIGFMRGFASEQTICNNCTFTKTGKYHMWTYGSNCTFNSCTFNSYGNGDCKAINIYKEGDLSQPYRTVTFNDCAFNSDPAVTTLDNSAIQINSQYCCFVVYINNCSVNGYINNSSSITGYPNLVNNKSTSVATTLYIDGVQILKQGSCDPVAKIDETYYTTLQDALDAAHGKTGDVTINIISDDINTYSIVHQKAGLNVTIEGNNHTVAGQIIVDGNARAAGTETLTIQNVAFQDDKSHFYTGTDAFILVPSTKDAGKPYYTNAYNYAHNITVENCSFTSTSSSLDVVGFKATSGAGNYNTVMNNVKGNNLHSLAQLTATTGATFINDTVTNSESFVNISGGGGNHNISNCSYTGIVPDDGYAVRKLEASAANVTLTDNDFTAYKVIVLGKNNKGNPTGEFNVVSGNYNGLISKEAADTCLAVFSFTGGTFDQDSATVAKWCAEGYCAVPNDPSAGFVTVRKMYQVNYDANGGTGTPMAPSYVRPFAGTTFEVKDNEGYTYGTANFTGWNTKADGTGTPFAAGATMAIESDTTLYAQWGYVAMIGTTPYATLQAAIDSANKNMTGDVTIDLVQNTSEYVEVLQVATNNLTINGNGNTLDGQMYISAKGDNWDGTDNITVTNMNFTYNASYFDGDVTDPNNEKGLLTFCKNCGSDRIRSIYNYAHNITISNCNFDADGSNKGAYAIASIAGSVNHLVIENCTAKNAKALASLQSDPQFVLTGCSTEDVTYGVRIVNNDGPMTVTHNNFTADEAGIFVDYMTSGAVINFSEDTVNAPKAFLLSNTSTSGTLDITSGLYIGAIEDNTGTDFFNISGGTYSKDVSGEPCAPGYAAFANGTNPETWTVTKAWFLYYDKNEAGASGTMDTLFVKQSGTVAERTLVVENCAFTWLPDHSFLAWNTKANTLGDTLHPGDNVILSSDTTLYVIWQEGYTIFYDNNGGVGTIPNQYKAVDETITLSDGTDGAGNYLFTRTDSTLYRWNTAADEGGDNYALGAEYSANANATMYAVWRLNLDMTMDSTDVVCYGENNGTDTVKIIGGDAPYMLVLSSSVLPQNDTVKNLMDTKYVFENLKPGSYNVELSDVLKKDFITGHFTIAQPDTLIVETMTVPVKPCPLMGTGVYNVSMTTTGGNGDNHFVWSDAAVDDDAMATIVKPGADDRDSTYTVTVTVTDKKGCSATRTETFSVSPVIADDGTVHANSKLTTNPDTIKVGIYQGCDTIIRDFGTFVFTSTNPAIDVNILDTVYNDVDVNYPDSTFPVGYSTITWTAVDTCGHSITGEQVVYIYHFPCPDAVLDGHTYHSVRLGCTCWLNENLRAENYSDGRPIENVMTYVSDLHPNTTENANIYGHLYDWYAAADTATNSIADIEATYALGKHIQGICPEGWSLPNDEDFNDFNAYDTKDLRSTDNWLTAGGSGAGTNATGFNAEPGGLYNCETGRFEDMGTTSYYWSCHPVYDMSTGAMIAYVCEKLQKTDPVSRCNGFSVRCVLMYEE